MGTLRDSRGGSVRDSNGRDVGTRGGGGGNGGSRSSGNDGGNDRIAKEISAYKAKQEAKTVKESADREAQRAKEFSDEERRVPRDNAKAEQKHNENIAKEKAGREAVDRTIDDNEAKYEAGLKDRLKVEHEEEAATRTKISAGVDTAILVGNIVPNPAVKAVSKGAGVIKDMYDRVVEPTLENYKEYSAAKSDAETLANAQAAADYAKSQSGHPSPYPNDNDLYKAPDDASFVHNTHDEM